ncbi:MAG: hypothetical protein ACTSX4_08960 [Candidatus Helarchaeota archaeon]
MNVHCAIGICISMIFLDYLNIYQILLIIGISVLIDIDFIFSKHVKDHNHRRLPTHSFIPYLIILPFGIFMIELLWVGIAGIFHVLLDILDWGIYPLTPSIRNRVLGGFLFTPKRRDDEPPLKKCYFINTYYGSKLIIVMEIIAFMAALSLILYRAFFYLILIIPYFILLAIHLSTYFKFCRKNQN